MSARQPDASDWLRRADHDMVTIERVAAKTPIPWDVVCFHAQQAAEKLLKALLIDRGIDPPHTHDLLMLLRLSDEAALSERRSDCELLIPMVLTGRYPAPGRDPTEAEGRAAIAAVERIRAVILPLFSK